MIFEIKISSANVPKGAVAALLQFLTTEVPLKVIKKNAFYFILNLFYLTFFHELFSHVGKKIDKKAKHNFKISDVENWKKNFQYISEYKI